MAVERFPKVLLSLAAQARVEYASSLAGEESFLRRMAAAHARGVVANAELPEEVQPIGKEFGELVVQEALTLLKQLPATVKAQITTLETPTPPTCWTLRIGCKPAE